MRTIAGILATILIGAVPALSAETGQVTFSGLETSAEISRDAEGIAHVRASNAVDLFMAQGWQHAADRLFQMDVLRRQASGDLAELLGPGALPQDVELRTIGLRRAAERALDAVSQETREALEAYAAGVNAFIAAGRLSPEYAALEITEVRPWTPVDSLAVANLLSFSLAFELDIEATIALQTYLGVGAIAGFDGAALFFEDTHRAAPFDPASTVPDAMADPLASATAAESVDARIGAGQGAASAAPEIPAQALKHALNYRARIGKMPIFEHALHPHLRDKGSNVWAIAGWRTVEGKALLANDPHLGLTAPALFYPIHLYSPSAGYDVIGNSLPGAPFVLLGQNANLAWGATTNAMDVTDTYIDLVVPDPNSKSGFSTLHDGVTEPLIALEQTFCFNLIGDGAPDNPLCLPPGGTPDIPVPEVVLISPRRNNGPVVDFDPVGGTALTIQYTGFSGTREADFFRRLNQARTLEDVTDALRYMDVGAQNFMIATDKGDIAYFTNAEVPLREDLQAMAPGTPPFLIRQGWGGEEWLIDPDPPATRATPYQIVPFAEMPQVVNPPSGVIVNANNDPLGHSLDNNPLNQVRPGGGIFYLARRWSFGTRAGRITRRLDDLLADGGLASFADMQDIQADVVMLDAEVLVPRILDAYDNAIVSGDPTLLFLAGSDGMYEAITRFRLWDGSAPTGIAGGCDASDWDGDCSAAPGEAEVEASVAATIYAMWRARIVTNTVDAVLEGIGAAAGLDLPPLNDELAMTAVRHLFDTFAQNQGTGASGLPFFNFPGIEDPAAKRDAIVLFSLREALDALAGPAFADVFGGNPDLDAYRWGLLHTLRLAHPISGPFSIPPGPQPAFPVDGGFGTVDAATHPLRAVDPQGFAFTDGPARRYVGEAGPGGGKIYAEDSLPGSIAGLPLDPEQLELLGRWLTNDTYIVDQGRAGRVKVVANSDGTDP